MTDLPVCLKTRTDNQGTTAHTHVTLTYDDRFLRRKVLTTAQG